MTVCVDTARHPYRGMIMCHMVADTPEELLAMADRIGVARRWMQNAGDPRREHFDICIRKKMLAVRFGAVEVSPKELAAYLARGKQEPPAEAARKLYRRNNSLIIEFRSCTYGVRMPY